MKKKSDDGTRRRIVRLLLAIAEQPRQFSKKDLAERYDCSLDTIKDDLAIIADCGLEVRYTPQAYRYYFAEMPKRYPRFQDLLHFSQEDRLELYRAIDGLNLPLSRKEALKAKLSALYDFRRLGHAYLREPYLRKMDLLEEAKSQKKQVVLEDYRSSNSNSVGNRIVEPFLINPQEDTVQTFEVEKGVVKHFRISRIGKVKINDTPWQYETWHASRQIDPFRIVNNNQVNIHLRLQLAAYNELTERFPATRAYILEAHEKGYYDFQCRVNSQFIGLSNFILGFYHQGIEILEPSSLREHLKKIIAGMTF